MTAFVSVLLSAVGTIIENWMAANDEQKAQIEAAALAGIQSMLSAATSTQTAHDARTAATQAAIAKALASGAAVVKLPAEEPATEAAIVTPTTLKVEE